MLGDFNMDLLSDISFANDLASVFGLEQHMTVVTRITAASAMLLDHIYTLGVQVSSTLVKELHRADHRAVSFVINANSRLSCNVQKHTTHSFCSMKNFDRTALCVDLEAVEWKTIIDSATYLDKMVEKFNSQFIDIWNKHESIISCIVRKHHNPG